MLGVQDRCPTSTVNVNMGLWHHSHKNRAVTERVVSSYWLLCQLCRRRLKDEHSKVTAVLSTVSGATSEGTTQGHAGIYVTHRHRGQLDLPHLPHLPLSVLHLLVVLPLRFVKNVYAAVTGTRASVTSRGSSVDGVCKRDTLRIGVLWQRRSNHLESRDSGLLLARSRSAGQHVKKPLVADRLPM